MMFYRRGWTFSEKPPEALPISRALVFVLLLLLFWPLLSPDWRAFATLSYLTGLGSALILGLALLRRASPWLERLVFLSFGVMTIAKALLYSATSLHLNGFILSMLWQFSPSEWHAFLAEGRAVIIVILTGGSLSIIAGVLVRRYTMPINFKILMAASLSCLIVSEMLTAHRYLAGDPRAPHIRKNMPYHISPHPYRLRQAAHLFGLDLPDNAFSKPLDFRVPKSAPLPPIKPLDQTPPSIILVIADSLRAMDIKADPTLMPSLTADPTMRFSLDHSSVSNCTHFSYFTLFNGLYPTRFSAARRGDTASILVQQLEMLGFDIRNFEASSLDWYDTRRFVFGADQPFALANAPKQIDRDDQAVTLAINALQTATDPYFYHLYLFGTHWPYASDGDHDGPAAHYIAAIQQLDHQIKRLKQAIDALPAEKRPILIVTSDHGEEIGDTIGHGASLSDAQTDVPFAIKAPFNLTTDLPASHLDVQRYILSLVTGEPFSASSETALQMNCSYDFPIDFRVRGADYDISFTLDDGILTPADPRAASPKQIKEAFGRLLSVLDP